MVVVTVLQSELSGYDARTAFALKARILYDTGDVTGEDFCDLERLNFNPTYPLLMPLVEAEMYWFQGAYQPPGLRLLFVGFVLAVASIYAAEIRRFASAGVAAWSAVLLLLTPMLIENFEGAGLSGSADLPLCAFVFAGTLELFRCCREPALRAPPGAGLLFGCCRDDRVKDCCVGGGGHDGLRPLTVGTRQPSSWPKMVGNVSCDSGQRVFCDGVDGGSIVRRCRSARLGASQHAEVAVLSVDCGGADRPTVARPTCRPALASR